MAISLNDNIAVQAPKPSDPRFFNSSNTPFVSLIEAKAQITGTLRHQGLFVFITINSKNILHWFKDGITDNDLVEFNSGILEMTISANTSFQVNAKKTINQIIIESNTTQTINVGTTSGGTELINAAAITSAGSPDNPFIVNKWLTSTSTIYITGITASTYFKFYIQ